MNELRKINILSIPEKYKESDLYKSLTNGDFEDDKNGFIQIINKFSNFDETVNDIKDIIRILNLYKYWMVSDSVFYDFILTNKERINIDDFYKIVVNFELWQTLICLLLPTNYMYSHIVNNTDLSLLSYLLDRNLINLNEFSQHAVRNLKIIKFLRKRNINISPKLLLMYGMNINNIKYLYYIFENYNIPTTNYYALIKSLVKCSFLNDWIFFLFDKIEIDYRDLLDYASRMNNSGVVLKILSENRIELESEKDIIDMYYDNKRNLNVLIWLKKNKMNFNHVIVDTDTLFEDYMDIENVFHYYAYGDNTYINNDLTDVTLEKFLVGTALNDENPKLLEWVLSFTEERPTEIINMAAFWWSDDLFIPLYEKGFMFDEFTCDKSLRGGCVDVYKYLIGLGCQYNITYDSCDFSYENDRPEMLKYLTSPELGHNFDNRYIIRSVKESNYEMFISLIENYPEIENYIFTGENSDSNNRKLFEYISIYRRCKENENAKKRRRL
jgi:hypothetical protein